jgi:hypothetical protein
MYFIADLADYVRIIKLITSEGYCELFPARKNIYGSGLEYP